MMKNNRCRYIGTPKRKLSLGEVTEYIDHVQIYYCLYAMKA